MEKGICVVWAPRAEIIKRLLVAANDDDLEDRLLENADAILVDLENRLSQSTHREIVQLRTLAQQAVASFREGRPEAAQALATSLLTNVVNVTFGFKRFDKAWKRWQREDPKSAKLGQYRFRVILWSFGRALHHTKYAGPGFNRHASAGHTALADQFTRANALQAVMLLTAVVRELHHWYSAQDNAAGQASAA